MGIRYFTQRKSRFALLCILLIMCVTHIKSFYQSNILPDQQVKYFQPTDCFLVSKKLTTRGRLVSHYRADFLISYSVNNVQYTRWVSGNGFDLALTTNKKEQESILSPYEVGKTYTCQYDATEPENAVLIIRHNWLSILPLIGPLMVTVIALYFFLKNVGGFIKYGYHKNRKRKKIMKEVVTYDEA